MKRYGSNAGAGLLAALSLVLSGCATAPRGNAITVAEQGSFFVG